MSVSLPILFDQIELHDASEIAVLFGEGEKGQTPFLDSMMQIFFLHHGEVKDKLGSFDLILQEQNTL